MCNKPQEVKAEPPPPAAPANGTFFDEKKPDSVLSLRNLMHAQHHKPRSSTVKEFYHHSFHLFNSKT